MAEDKKYYRKEAIKQRVRERIKKPAVAISPIDRIRAAVAKGKGLPKLPKV